MVQGQLVCVCVCFKANERSRVNCGRCHGTWSGWNVKVTVDTVGYFLYPPSTLQWFTASQLNIWISAVLPKHVERETDKVKIRSRNVSLLVNTGRD